MILLTSARNGYQMLGFAGLLKGLVIVWLLPSAVALVALALQWLFGTVALGSAGMMMWAATLLMLLSPVLSWLGLVLAGPVVSALMDRGWFGWIPAMVLGLLIGSLTAWLMDHELAISFGTFLILALRAVLGRLCPAAFAPEGA